MRMQVFAIVLLVLGIIGSLVIAFTLAVVWIPYDTRYSTTYSAQFNAIGLVAALASFAGSLVLYYIMKGIALIGIRAYPDQNDSALSAMGTNAQIAYEIPEEEANTLPPSTEYSKRPDKTLIAVVALGIAVVLLVILLAVLK